MKNYAALFTFFLILLSATSSRADQLTLLGTASTFAVLGASTVTNVGPSIINGDLGLSPGTSITNFPPGIVDGLVHNSDTAAITAQADALAAYNYLANLASISTPHDLSGENLGARTLGPGVYSYVGDAELNGTLTLDFGGTNDADIVIEIAFALKTDTDSVVTVINKGTNDNVYYRVGSSATLGLNSTFAGDILANSSITLNTGAGSSCGSVIALNGAVTLNNSTVNNCSSTGSNITAFVPVTNPVPEPSTLLLLSTGMIGAAATLRRSRL